MARQNTTAADSFDEVLGAIEAGKHKPVYIFHGSNVQLIEQAVAGLKKHIAGGNEDFGYQVYRGEETRGLDLVNAARTVPMLAEEQLIVVRHADALSADDLEVISAYLEKPNPSTCLVLLMTKVDKRLKFFLRAHKRGMLFEAGAVTERELASFIVARGRRRGLFLTPQVAHLLGEATGTDSTVIEDALERLSLYVGEGREVDAASVEAVVSASRVHSIFELTDAIGRRDAAGALRTLANMLQNREAPLRILATMATHVRRLLHAAELGPAALNQPDGLSSTLGIPPFLARKVAEQARRFSALELRAAVRRLALTDLELKSVKRPDDLVMEEMILDLCLGKPRVRREHHRTAAFGPAGARPGPNRR